MSSIDCKLDMPVIDIEQPELVALEPQGSLLPIIAQDSQRYTRTKIVSPTSLDIQPGQFTFAKEAEPGYLPPGWSATVQPEGQLYFHRTAPLRIVTDEYLYNSETLWKISFWAKHVEGLLLDQKIKVSDDTELFLELSGKDDCDYYLVDFKSQTTFWLESVSSEELGLPSVVSADHLRLALEQQFWTHVERFPVHFGGLSVKHIDDLICILSHAQVDHMTSMSPTFCYSKETCAEFIQILKISRDYPSDSRQTCLVARLWSFIVAQRVITHYGQQQTRLERDQAIVYETPRRTWFTSISSGMTFQHSDRFLKDLESLYADRLVYDYQWKLFIKEKVDEWRRLFSMTAGLLLLSIVSTLFLPHHTMLMPAIILMCLGMGSCVMLLHSHSSLEKPHIDAVVSHFEAIYSGTHGLSAPALLYSLPSAFLLWSVIALVITGLYSVGISMGLWVAVGLATGVALFILAFQVVMSGIHIPFPSFSWARRCMSDDAQV